MRLLCVLTFTSLVAAAQIPPATVVGMLLERDIPAEAGQIAIRATDSQVFRFRFDAKTTVDLENLTEHVAALNLGEKIEVDSEAVEGSLVRYAKAIKVLVPITPKIIRTNVPVRPPDRIFSSATLTYSGVVSKMGPDRLVLHTREGDRTILIRRDTSYVENGGTVEAAALRPNMRVYVRAGKDLWERIEAYQVIWGRIFDPRR